MNIQSKLKHFLTRLRPDSPTQQIVINNRSDGLSLSGLPAHISPEIVNYPKYLLCGDGTKLSVKDAPILVSGISDYRKEILYRQIASAVSHGYTPFVLSSNGRTGEIYSLLRTIYYENDIFLISNDSSSGYYLPFMAMNPFDTADFFYQIAVTINPGLSTNSMLVKQYINVCVAVFCRYSRTVQSLWAGQFDHTTLIEEIRRLGQEGRLNASECSRLITSAEAARSVSIAVLSVFYDVMYQLRNPLSAKTGAFPFNFGKLADQRCVFVSVGNSGGFQQQNLQCYQWYLSKILEQEYRTKQTLHRQNILLIVENLNSTNLRWFSWVEEISNCQILISYQDFYSLLSDAPDVRERLISKVERIYLFSHMNVTSAEWCSRFIGEHMVTRYTQTTRGATNLSEILFPITDVSQTEETEAWYKKEEIQRLGNAGIVYCRSENVFRGGRNFCQFSFR